MAYRIQQFLGLVSPSVDGEFIVPRMHDEVARARRLERAISEGGNVRVVLRSEGARQRLSSKMRKRLAGLLRELDSTGKITVVLAERTRPIKDGKTVRRYVRETVRQVELEPGRPVDLGVQDACLLLDADKYGYLIREVDPARPDFDPDEQGFTPAELAEIQRPVAVDGPSAPVTIKAAAQAPKAEATAPTKIEEPPAPDEPKAEATAPTPKKKGKGKSKG